MTIDWAKIGEICDAINQIGGVWILGGGILLVGIKYVKNILSFFKDFFLIPKRVKFMIAELSHNGGSSIKDALNRIENRQISNELKLIYVVDSIENSGSFETDITGSCVKVSVGYCHLIGRNEEESLGTGWTNYLHPEDKQKVMKDWEEAIESKRYYIGTYRMIKNDEIFTVFCRAYPLTNTKKEVLGYFGIIKKV